MCTGCIRVTIAASRLWSDDRYRNPSVSIATVWTAIDIVNAGVSRRG